MKYLVMIAISFVFGACNKFSPEKISKENPAKIECFDAKNNLVFSGTAVSVKEMATREGFIIYDLNGNELKVVAKCRLAAN